MDREISVLLVTPQVADAPESVYHSRGAQKDYCRDYRLPSTYDPSVVTPFQLSFRPGISLYEQVVYAAKKAVISGNMKAETRSRRCVR